MANIRFKLLDEEQKANKSNVRFQVIDNTPSNDNITAENKINLPPVKSRVDLTNNILTSNTSPLNSNNIFNNRQMSLPVFNKISDINNQQVVQTNNKNNGVGETNSDGYTYTGKNYGDYFYQNYAKDKDLKIYSKDGKYYLYDGFKYRDVDSISFMTSTKQDEEDKKKAVSLGYKDWKNDNKKLKVSDMLKLDTANLTNKEYSDYSKDLSRQREKEETAQAEKYRINYGGALGTLKQYADNASSKINKELVQPIKNIQDNYETGKLNNQLALEYYKQMNGEPNDVSRLKNKIDTYNSFNQDLLNDPGLAGTAIQNANTQIESLKNQGIAATVLGGTGAVIGAAFGGAPGALTGAKVGGSIGYTVGSTPYTYMLEAGNQYQALIDMGVPKDVAAKHAKTTGAINAAIESGENIIDLATLGISSLSGKAVSKEVVNELVDDYGEKKVREWLSKKVGAQVADKIVNIGTTGVKSYAQNIASEAIEEMTQEGTSIASERLATNESGIKRETTIKDDINRILKAGESAAVSTALTGPVFSMVGSVTTNIHNSIESKIQNKTISTNTINETISDEITKEYEKTGEYPTGEQISQIQQTIYSQLANENVDIVNNENNTPISNETDNSINYTNQEKTNENSAQEKKLEEIGTQLNTLQKQIKESNDNSSTFAQDNKTINKYEYKISDNDKINKLNESAVQNNFNNSEQTKKYMQILEKIIRDKNVSIIFDSNLKTPDGRFVNGKYENGTITINPNSNRMGEFIAIHELTHAIGTDSMKNIIETYRKSNSEFNKAITELLSKNYNTNELTEEAMADVSAQLFGNQEFINNLSQNNPNLFKRIYNEIKYLWHQFRGYTNQNQFIEDLQYKWEQAYKKNNKLNNTTNYSFIGKKNIEKTLKNKDLSDDQKMLLDKIKTNYNQALNDSTKKTNEQLRRDTGWFKDKNGDWKFEITDKNSDLKIQPQKNTQYKLEDLLDHDLLYDVEPRLKQITVKFKDLDNSNGKYRDFLPIRQIVINNNLISKGNEAVKSTLLHEIQHYNQYRNHFEKGLSSGTTLQDMIDYVNSLGEIEAKDVQRRKDLNQNELKNVTPESSKKNPVHPSREQLIKKRILQLANSNNNKYNSSRKGRGNFDEKITQSIQKNKNEDSNNYKRNGIKELDNSSFSYRGSHQIENAKSITELNLNDIKNKIIELDGYLTNQAQKDLNKLKKILNNPNEKVTIYRASPVNELNSGDWVTTDKSYAKNVANNNGGKVYSYEVDANELYYPDNVNDLPSLHRLSSFQYNENTQNNVKYSLSNEDNQGRKLSKQQQDFFKDSAIRVKQGRYGMPEISNDGNLFEVYHGTNNDFTKFDSNYFGSSNDMGWYGPGFYFAFTEGEAKTYGSKVMKSYLNIKNPFFFSEEMQTYDGKDSGDVNYDFGSFMINMKNKFPEISKKTTLKYSEYSDKTGDLELKEITIEELGKKIEEIYNSKDLKMITIDDNGVEKYQYVYENDLDDYKIPSSIKKLITEQRIYNKNDAKFATENSKYYYAKQEDLQSLYDYYKKTNNDFSRSYIGYPNTNKEVMKNSRLTEATWYVAHDVYHNLDMHMPEYYMQYLGNDIQKELIKKGYDGVVQSKSGDEIVAFYPNQIKNVDNLNPTINDDIRYSKNNETWQEYLENNFESKGTTTKIGDLKIPTKKKVNPPVAKTNTTETYGNPTKASSYGVPTKEDIVKSKVSKEINKNSTEALKKATSAGKTYLQLKYSEAKQLKEDLRKYVGKTKEQLTNAKTYNSIRDEVKNFMQKEIEYLDNDVKQVKNQIRNTNIKVDENLKEQITDYNDFRKSNFGKLKLSSTGQNIDSIYQELSDAYPYYFSSDINTEADMLYELSDFMNRENTIKEKYNLTDSELETATKKIFNALVDNSLSEKQIEEIQDELMKKYSKKTRKLVQEELLNDMGITLDDISSGKDISSLGFQRTDPVRLNEKVFGAKVGRKINNATINHTKHNEAERTRFLNKQRNEIKELDIKARSKESAAVQKYAEKQYINKYGELVKYGNKELASEFPNIETQNKIKHAAEVLRGKYDAYIEQINDVITELGYDPIPKRQDYMRHFNELNDKLSQWGIPLNPADLNKENIPTDINGLTDQFKPGKNWFASAMQRKGLNTTYDAITGIDGYLEGASNLIYHTEDIQRYRALSKMIRDTYGQTHGLDGIDVSTQEGQQRLNDIFDNKLSKYAAWLDEQANALAGKKGGIDRAAERLLGRKIYSVLDTAKKQVGSNMTGFNVRSALTNFASAVQGASKTNKSAFIKGTVSTLQNMIHNDGLIDKSDFLTSRFGSNQLSKKLWQKASNAGQIFMTGTDYFTANQIWRSKYYENLSKGMTETQAIKKADDFASRIMGDRSKGATAELFNSKTLGLLTQFQLEVNNQWSSMIHDNKMDIQNGEKTGATVVFQLGQLAAMSYMFNNLMKALTGSSVMFDPIDLLKKMFGSDDDEDKSLEDRATEVLGEILDNLPFASIFNGGRIPVGEAFKGAGTLLKKLTNQKGDYGNEIKWEDVKDDLISSAFYWLLPTGYGQAKKTYSGLSMYDSKYPIAGSYTKTGRLRFPVNKDVGSVTQAALFGQYANKNAREYLDNGYTPLTEKQQKIYKNLNIPISDYWKNKTEYNYSYENPEKYAAIKLIADYDSYTDYSKQINEIKKKYDNTNIRKEKVMEYIDSLDLNKNQKAIFKKLVYTSYTNNDNQIMKYVNNLDITENERGNIYKALGMKR